MKQPSSYDNRIFDAKRIHMIGIGGSGMSPLAELLHAKGYAITGSDNNPSYTLERIQSLGIPVAMGHRAENIGDADLVIHSAAIMADNPELAEAHRRGIPTLERSYLLGALTRRFDDVIGVCGTHGKTTVTSMIALILCEGGLDPSAVIGGMLPAWNSNCRIGRSEHLVCESCEYVDTFLKMSPDLAVLLNVDDDHLEYFKTMDRLIESFGRFLGSASRGVLVNGDDEKAMRAAEQAIGEVVTFGYGEGCDWRPTQIAYVDGAFGSFHLTHRGEDLGEIRLHVPGHHNVLNAVAAAAAAITVGADFPAVQKGLVSFRGAKRRFEILYRDRGITVADDYAHHPSELRATLETAKQLPYQRVIAVFQPFTYSRTVMLMDDFAQVLSLADQVVLSEIMGSREVNTYGVCSADLAARIDGSVWFSTFDEIADYVAAQAREGDLILTMGCGDIYKAAKKIIALLQA